MADVNVIIKLYSDGVGNFNPTDIITLTVNGGSKTLSSTSYGYTTGTLIYAEGTPLNIAITFSPQYYENESWSENAAEGTIEKQLTLVRPTESSTWVFDVSGNIPSGWVVNIRSWCLGRPIILVDNIPILLIDKIDNTPSGNIKMIDGVFIADGTWHVDVRDDDVGEDWEVTITS